MNTYSYDSTNNEVGYQFVSAAKVNKVLAENGIVTLANSKKVESKVLDTGIYAEVEVEITLVDADFNS